MSQIYALYIEQGRGELQFKSEHFWQNQTPAFPLTKCCVQFYIIISIHVVWPPVDESIVQSILFVFTNQRLVDSVVWFILELGFCFVTKLSSMDFNLLAQIIDLARYGRVFVEGLLWSQE